MKEFKNKQNVEEQEEEVCCLAENNSDCEAETPEGSQEDGQIDIFGEANGGKKKETKQSTPGKSAPKTKTFAEQKKVKIIYATHEIDIQEEHQNASEKELWEQYLKDRFPEFRDFNYVVLKLGEGEMSETVFPFPKAFKMG